MSDVHSPSSSESDDDYQTCDEDDEADVPRAAPPSSSSSEHEGDWLKYYHTSDEEEEEELDVLGAAPVVAVKKETRQLYTRSLTGLGQRVQEMLQSSDQSNTQLVPAGGSEQSDDTLAAAAGRTFRGSASTTLVQLNVTQQFGDVTVGKATQVNQSFGGCQNISKTATINEGQKGGELSRADQIMMTGPDPLHYILARTKDEVDCMTAGMVRVSAVDVVVNMLSSGEHWVTITGNAGDGKTTLGYLILKEFLQKVVGVYTLYKPDEYDQIAKMKEDKVIMFDDRFGTFLADHQLIKSWHDVIQKLSRVIERVNANTKVIFISRKNVVNESKVYLGPLTDTIFERERVVDLSKGQLSDERTKIMDYHLGLENVTIHPEIKTKVCNMEVAHGFPYCCKMFSKLRSKGCDVPTEEYFESPLKFLDMTTKVLYNETCRQLFQLMIRNGGQLDIKERHDLLKVVKEQEGSYITVLRNGMCQFAHPSVYESVLNVINDIDPLFCVQYATLSIMRQKMIITTSDEEDRSRSACYIIVKPIPAVLKTLAERFREEILEGDYSVFKHRLCQSREFCEALVSCCVTTDNTKANSKRHIDALGQDDRTMLWTALLARRSCAFHVLLREGANLNIKENGNTPLLYLCKQDDADFESIRMVIEKKENCNDRGEGGETPLLCLLQRDEVDLTLLTDFITIGKADCTIRDGRGISPLSYLCRRKRVDIEALTLMFTEGGADINHPDENGDTPLHWLSRNSSVYVDDIKRLTLVGHGDINKPNENGSTPLHFLCKRKIDIESLVSLIQEHNVDINKKDQFGNTPLLYLCFSNKQKVKYLLEKIPEADISITNEFGYAAEDYLHGKVVPLAGTGPTMIKVTVERKEWNIAIGSQIAQLGAGGMASNTTFLGATTAGVPRIDPMEILARTMKEIELKTAGMIRVSAMEDVLKKFNNGQQWVTITGNAGEGKTTLGYLLLREFLQNYNEVYTLYRPEEFDKIENMEEKRVIMLDDRFGAFQADPQKIDKWFDVIDRILSKTYEKKTKIIFIIRTNVVKKARNYLGHLTDNIFDRMCVVGLSNRELTQELREERLKILNHHLKHEKVKIHETLKRRVCKMEVGQGFPQCCKMFAKLTPNKYGIHIVDFFKSPLKFLDMTTKILYDGNCQNLFKLMIKNDGQLDIQTIEEDDKREALLKVQKEQEGSYISVSRNNVCEFAHPSVYESVLNVINEVDPLFCVRYATLSIIRQRMMIPTTDEENNRRSPLYILLKPNPIVLKALALRFREEILKGDYSVFKHRLCHSGDFCKALIFCCVRLDEKNESKQFINAPGNDGNTMFLTALRSGNITTVWVLMEAGLHTLDVNVSDEYGRSPLHFLLDQQKIHKEATHVMIRDMKGNPNLPDNNGSTPLHYFCRRRNISTNLLKLMITEGKGDLNKCEQNMSTPLHYLCANSGLQLDTVKLVTKEGRGDFNKGDEHGTTPFHYLCGRERVELDVVLQIVNTAKGDINKQDNNGITPLHMLCKGSLQMTNILTLISKGDKADKYGNTPLHFLCRRRGITADEEYNLKQLPEIDMEKPNVFGYTPLEYLVDKDEHLPWTDGILARSAADLVVCWSKQGDNQNVVLGPAMTLSSEKVHEWLQVEDFGRDLTNMVHSGRRNSPGQFSVFQGSCSSPFKLPSSLLSPSPYPVTTPSYWETSSILRWGKTDRTLLLEMGVVEGQKLDIGSCVSDFANSFSVSLEYGCSFHDQPNSLCIQVRRREQEGRLHQVGQCVSLSLPVPGEEFTLAFGLVLDVERGRVGFIDVERGELLCKVKQRFTEDVFPMFHVHRFEGHCASRMRLVSGRQISLNDRKIHLIQQALFD